MRRFLIFVSCICAAMLALSCSMRAAMSTDGEGRVVGVSSIRFESSLARVAVAMLVAGGQFAVELRWLRGFSSLASDHVQAEREPGAGSGLCDATPVSISRCNDCA